MMNIHTTAQSGIWAVIGSMLQVVFGMSSLGLAPRLAVDFLELTIELAVGFDLSRVNRRGQALLLQGTFCLHAGCNADRQVRHVCVGLGASTGRFVGGFVR